jgi:hypothetical protein
MYSLILSAKKRTQNPNLPEKTPEICVFLAKTHRFEPL